MKQIVCDRCHQVVAESDEMEVREIALVDREDGAADDLGDFCPKCLGEFRAWLKPRQQETPLPSTLCPQTCTYPNCDCAVSYMPADRQVAEAMQADARPAETEALPTMEEMRLLLDRLCMSYFGQGKNGLPGVRRLALESAIATLHARASK